MKGLIIVPRGLEPIAQQEIFELVGKKSICHEFAIELSETTTEELCTLAYHMHSCTFVLELLGTFPIVTTLHETLKLFQTHISVHEHFQTHSQKSFVVSCEREGTHAFTSQDFSGALMHYLQTSSPTFPQTINYKTPELRLMTLLVESSPTRIPFTRACYALHRGLVLKPRPFL